MTEPQRAKTELQEATERLEAEQAQRAAKASERTITVKMIEVNQEAMVSDLSAMRQEFKRDGRTVTNQDIVQRLSNFLIGFSQ